MRISDWSSDVCSSDLTNSGTLQSGGALSASISEQLNNTGKLLATGDLSILAADSARTLQIGNGGSAYLQSGGLLTIAGTGSARRSEEHTSELQSLMRISYAVFCLKKKKNTRH